MILREKLFFRKGREIISEKNTWQISIQAFRSRNFSLFLQCLVFGVLQSSSASELVVDFFDCCHHLTTKHYLRHFKFISKKKSLYNTKTRVLSQIKAYKTYFFERTEPHITQCSFCIPLKPNYFFLKKLLCMLLLALLCEKKL